MERRLQYERKTPLDLRDCLSPPTNPGPSSGLATRPSGPPLLSCQSSPGPSSGLTATPANKSIESVRETEHKALLNKLSFVIQYREHKTAKSKALTNILGLLEGDLTLGAPKKEKAVDLYIEELNSAWQGDIFWGIGTQHRDSQAEGEIDRSVHQLLKEVSHGAKSHDELSESNSDGPQEPSSKRQKIRESEMPWYKQGELSDSPQSASSRKTCESLRVFHQDIPGCKFWVKFTQDMLPSVPSPQ